MMEDFQAALREQEAKKGAGMILVRRDIVENLIMDYQYMCFIRTNIVPPNLLAESRALYFGSSEDLRLEREEAFRAIQEDRLRSVYDPEFGSFRLELVQKGEDY